MMLEVLNTKDGAKCEHVYTESFWIGNVLHIYYQTIHMSFKATSAKNDIAWQSCHFKPVCNSMKPDPAVVLNMEIQVNMAQRLVLNNPYRETIAGCNSWWQLQFFFINRSLKYVVDTTICTSEILWYLLQCLSILLWRRNQRCLKR